MAVFWAAGWLLALKMTSLAPALFAACLAPSLIWLKNRACWLIVTSATVSALAVETARAATAAARLRRFKDVLMLRFLLLRGPGAALPPPECLAAQGRCWFRHHAAPISRRKRYRSAR